MIVIPAEKVEWEGNKGILRLSGGFTYIDSAFAERLPFEFGCDNRLSNRTVYFQSTGNKSVYPAFEFKAVNVYDGEEFYVFVIYALRLSEKVENNPLLPPIGG